MYPVIVYQLLLEDLPATEDWRGCEDAVRIGSCISANMSCNAMQVVSEASYH